MFKKRSEHIGEEDLSEYLDGRLVGRRLDEVEVHLASCAVCKEELSSLEYTVGLLQQVPMFAPGRRVAIEDIPVASPGWGFRAPSWAYGAAASVAIMLFALVIAADLGGLLAGDARQQETVATSQIESQTSPQAESEVAAATAVDENDGLVNGLIKEQDGAAADPEAVDSQNTEIELPFEAAPPAFEADAPVESARPIVPGEDAESVVVPIEEPISDAGQEPEAEAATGAADERTSTLPDGDAGLGLPVESDAALITPGEILQGDDGGTSVFWRVLEGVSGGLAALLLGAVVWRFRRFRRPTG